MPDAADHAVPLAVARARESPAAGHVPRVAADAVFVGPDGLGDHPFIVVDGRAPTGPAALELSHWPGCATPGVLAATTATGIVDRYLRWGARGPEVRVVTNNHYDVDGVLAAWMLLHPPPGDSPQRALAVEAAATGDFGVWGDPDALRVAITLVGLVERASTPLRAVRDALDAGAGDPTGPLHQAVLPRVERVLGDVERFAWLWGPTFAAISADCALVDDGAALIEEHPDLDLAVVRTPRPLARAAVMPRTDRSRVMTVCDDGTVTVEQRYETWVAFSERPRAPRVDLAAAARDLQAEETHPGTWRFDGLGQSTPRLQLLGPDGARRPSGIDPERIRAVITGYLTDGSTRDASASLG